MFKSKILDTASGLTEANSRPAMRSEFPRFEVDDMPAWKPTAKNINALPEPVRQYIHDLQTVCDPAGDIQMLHILRQENRALRFECERLARKAGEMPKVKPRRSRRVA
jgi:hypothetical protein